MKHICICAGFGIGSIIGAILLVFGLPFAIGIGVDVVDLAGPPLFGFWSVVVAGFLSATMWRLRRHFAR
jgi:hypothetical protein